MSKRILVIEDQEDDRQIIRDVLAGTNYEITEAEDGEHALAAVAKERPDLILIEISYRPWMATRQCDGSGPILRFHRSPLSRSPPTRQVRKSRRPERLAATTLCPSLTAHTNCWRKFAITCTSG